MSAMVRTTSLIRYLKRALFFTMSAVVLSYLGYHAVIGDRGLLAWFRLQKEVETLSAELEQVRGERARLEHRVALMRPESLDPDMLDKRARELLNLAHPNEITILRSAK